VHAVDAERIDIADRAVVDALDHLLAGLGVPPHKPRTDLESLLLGFLGGFQQPAHAGRVGGERLLHEHVDALLHRVFEMRRAEGGKGREQHHVARTQAVDGLLVGVEAQEAAFGRHRDLVRMHPDKLL